MTDSHFTETPSNWVVRFASMIPPSGSVLDLACGAGRHSRFLASLGYSVLAVDIDISRLGAVAAMPGVTPWQADLENASWPFADRQFTGIVVTNYLYRPLFPQLMTALTAGGLLIYETFARGNEQFGKPSNANFLLMPGELLKAVEGRARVIAYEDIVVDAPKPAAIQRICALRE